MHGTEDETEAVAQLQAMGFEWSDAWTHWRMTYNGKNVIVLTAMSGWWAVYGRNQSPVGVTHPMDVVAWVCREMDANG